MYSFFPLKRFFFFVKSQFFFFLHLFSKVSLFKQQCITPLAYKIRKKKHHHHHQKHNPRNFQHELRAAPSLKTTLYDRKNLPNTPPLSQLYLPIIPNRVFFRNKTTQSRN
ncbi:hypothetical protein BSKO_09381 [Bryopsis sp. KO-2023]|nr:hypothetical protein BSKO_09381 [Bryopsis sp. KO-2023]